MSQAPSGSFRLFRVAGIDVYLHWSWFLVAYYQIMSRPDMRDWTYQSPVWNVVEYLSLFGIVLLHEFGHALACRSVGGTANRIVLWPLGGIAYVNPPPRPGALLWSIAAGPLVNLVLVPLTVGLWLMAQRLAPGSDVARYSLMIAIINFVLLVFNLLPVYPLDGGQIFHAVLWFVFGRVSSLVAVSVIGLVCGIATIALAVYWRDWWLLIIAAFVAMRCIAGFRQARVLSRILSGPRHPDAACPSCGEPPFKGIYWACDRCRTRFDAFEHRAVCPGCGNAFPTTMCPLCHQRHPVSEWLTQQPYLDRYQSEPLEGR